MDGQLKAVGNSRFGQQFLRTSRVIGFRLQVRADSEEAVWKQLPSLDRHAFHHPVHDRIAANRLRDRLANTQVLQRILDGSAIL